MAERNAVDAVAIPAMLSAARRPYGEAIRSALESAGMDDMPPRGAFIVGSIDRGGTSMNELPGGMGVSKQAISQIVDTLVARGYLDRAPDTADRRRMRLSLTDRGREAAKISRRAVATVDRRLTQRVGADAVASTRQVLAALTSL